MIFLPFGFKGGEVCDPDVTAEDFFEAMRVASRLTQWQFANDAFTDRDVITPQESVRFHMLEARGLLQTTPGVDPILTAAMGAVDPDIWQIPYNRGFQEIGDGDVAHVWTSKFPELVMSVFTFQYIRIDQEDFPDYDAADPTTWLHVRAQIAIAFDGARMPGTGPFANPIDTTYRGTGLGQRATRTTVVALGMLPAGAHRVAPMGAQQAAVGTAAEGYTDETRFLSNPPVEGVCIGNRRHILLRFGRGAWLNP
jgi:hypothetical protein